MRRQGKKLNQELAVVARRFAYYNSIKIHRSLRLTPAMAAEPADQVRG